MQAMQAARYLCACSDWTLTTMRLHKLLYIAQMVHLGRHGQPLMAGRFLAKAGGPYLVEIDPLNRYFGAKIIPSYMFSSKIDPDLMEKDTLDQVWSLCAPLTGAQLVAMTHRDDTAWGQAYTSSFENVIAPRAMADEYHRRSNKDLDHG